MSFSTMRTSTGGSSDKHAEEARRARRKTRDALPVENGRQPQAEKPFPGMEAPGSTALPRDGSEAEKGRKIAFNLFFC